MKRLLIALLSCAVVVPAWSDCIFREDTASQSFLVGPFLDGTDGISAEVAITPANTDIRISKNGANTIAKNSGGCTHDESGMYLCVFDATDTDTAGMLQIYTDNSIDATTIVPVFHECLVYATGYFDLLDGTTSIMTSKQAGNILDTTVSSVTSQLIFVLTAGDPIDDSYNNLFIEIEDVAGSGYCARTVDDYGGGATTVTIDSVCGFAVAATDFVRIRSVPSAKMLRDLETTVDGLNDLSSAQVEAALLGATVDGTIDVQCALALAAAYGSGKWSTAGNVVTYRDPTDGANRIVGTISGSSFDSITLTCP